MTTHMSYTTFLAVCGEFLIDPSIAFENRRVVEACRVNDVAALRIVLSEEF